MITSYIDILDLNISILFIIAQYQKRNKPICVKNLTEYIQNSNYPTILRHVRDLEKQGLIIAVKKSRDVNLSLENPKDFLRQFYSAYNLVPLH